jgi:hypothetical protein
MSDREEALDFIYKGWRDGRQNRRDFRHKRGQERLGSMLAPTLERPQRDNSAPSVVSSPPNNNIRDDNIITDERRMLPAPREEVASTPPSQKLLPAPREKPHQKRAAAKQRIEDGEGTDEDSALIDDWMENPGHITQESYDANKDKEYLPDGGPPKIPELEDLPGRDPQPEPPKPTADESDFTNDITDPDDHQEDPAFNTVWEDMRGEEHRGMNEAIGQGIDEGQTVANKLGQEFGAEDAATPEPIPSKKVEEAVEQANTIGSDLSSATNETNPDIAAVDRSIAEAAKEYPKSKSTQFDQDSPSFDESKIRELLEVADTDPDAWSELKNGLNTDHGDLYEEFSDMPRPRPEVEGKATEKGKADMNKVIAALEGKEPSKTKEEAPPKRKKQDIGNLEKPTKFDVQRSFDEQITDSLLKKLPVHDLRRISDSVGGFDINVILDKLGFITQAQGIDPAQVALAAASDKPNPFQSEMDPSLSLDTQRLKFQGGGQAGQISNTSKKQMLEDLMYVPQRRVAGSKRMSESQSGSPPYEIYDYEEDFGRGWMIRDDDGSKRRMTETEAKAAIGRGKGGGSSGPSTASEMTTPRFDSDTHRWFSHLTKPGRSHMPPEIFGERTWKPSTGADKISPWAGIDTAQLGFKEIASVSPKDFKDRIKSVKGQNTARIGNSQYSVRNLEDMARGISLPNSKDNFDMKISGGENFPLKVEGRGVNRQFDDPSYIENLLAPRVEALDEDGQHNWSSMNDLFE